MGLAFYFEGNNEGINLSEPVITNQQPDFFPKIELTSRSFDSLSFIHS
jgi:hypothetical protein